MNTTISERVALLAAINPIDGATTARSSGWVHVRGWGRLIGVALLGNITGTIDVKFQQATSAAGAGVKDVAGRAITQLTATDDDKQALINLNADHLDRDGGFHYVRLTITPTGGTANLVAGAVLGADPRYGAASANDAATVAQIV